MIDLNRPSLIEIGSNVDINDNFTIMCHDYGTFVFKHLYDDFVNSSGRVRIGNNVYIGRDVTLLRGASIGDNCIIGVGSVVTKAIPPNSVAVGAPCRRICSIEEYYQKRKALAQSEALDYGVSIVERFHREPQIDEFWEEWGLFLSKEDWDKYPSIRGKVRPRRRGALDEAFWNRERPYANWAAFKEAVMAAAAPK